jgi:hypothetical protein
VSPRRAARQRVLASTRAGLSELTQHPGLVVLFGSGEIAPSGRKVHDWVMRQLSLPIRVAILETPAGFQPNSELVAGKMADFLNHRLQNYQPEVTVIPARKRDTPFSPDAPDIVSPLLRANYIFWGPGSPTYAVRQLEGSLAWFLMVARHRLGAAMVSASAAAIASGAFTLPVYEIYKVGADLHWVRGLDFFGAYGLTLAIVSHWDNTEGGAELDTRCGLMGRARFQQLAAMLPGETTVVGIDEHTALVMDLEAAQCQVMGRGTVTVIRSGRETQYRTGERFAVSELGPFQLPAPEAEIPEEIWEEAVAAQIELQEHPGHETPADVLALVEEREAARARRDWVRSDELRDRIAGLGWQIRDTAAGPQVLPLGEG